MTNAIKWMAKNHVAANLLMMFFIAGGLIKGSSIKQEVFPEISLDKVQVTVVYPGAGPEEVEEGILLQIEDSLTGVDGIKEINSIAAEGAGTVIAEIRTDADTDIVLQDIKSAVDRITTFPEDAEKPIISKLLNRTEVISIIVYGNVSEKALREQAEQIREDLLNMPNITQVDLGGVRPYEISIEIPEENLRKYDLTLNEVARRIRRASLDLPGGTIKTVGGEILLRTKERRYRGVEYADITIISNPDGTEVKLGDIAEILDTFRDTDIFARLDGKPAAMVKVFRVANQKPTEISAAVKKYVKDKKNLLPDSINITTNNDTSDIFKSRRDLLLKNARYGLFLVFIVLGLFLEIRLALWVMLGVPISFFGALLLMPVVGVSINMISLFAFILALGILVDDAIVVGENIYEHRQKGKPFQQAAIDGVLEVATPVIFSILTTIAAFLPLVFVSGMMGKFIKVLPLVVITLFTVSLVESLFVLPSHLAKGKKRNGNGYIIGRIDRIRNFFGKALEGFISGPYRKTLSLCLRNRYVTVATGVMILMLIIGVVRGGLIKFTFMPTVEGDIIISSLKMPLGTSVGETDRVQNLIVKKGMEVVSEYDAKNPDKESVLVNIFSIVGSTLPGFGPGGGEASTGSHMANIAMFLTGSEERSVPAYKISNSWRDKVGDIPGVDSLTFSSNIIHIGNDIDVQIAHNDPEVLTIASKRIKDALAKYDGVSDIDDNYSKGKKELKIYLKPAARISGVTAEELGRQIRSAFYGAEALRLQRGRNEVKVMVRYPERYRKSLWNLNQMRIRTPEGGEIPLEQAAKVILGRGFSTINRTDRKRVVNVTASVDDNVANSEEVIESIQKGVLADLRKDYPGITFNMVGEEKERRESMGSMREGFLLALLGIYTLLAIPFKSYSQPLLIMMAIPFGIVGAILGHLIMGYDLSILSMFGIVALAGVVVNDSLLLIDQANRNHREGADIVKSIQDAGTRRFRPILLTSLTTFFGLTPMILEKSVQAKFLIPMAISLGFGILFATGITLILIPSLYLILEDIKRILRFGKSETTETQ